MKTDFTPIDPWTYSRDAAAGVEYWTYQLARGHIILGRYIGNPDSWYSLYNNRDLPAALFAGIGVEEAKKRVLEAVKVNF
ncbi:hypothetical protein [Roseibium aggregatum]|uniref:Uncharacterized protein n=1 Tax=Roseibium aggregatum TaxID=187304 RepID=A0A0M6Y7T8_9HYPH|nr:hypothetical protein [Roseibium aggregatum]CTQ45738.1 hypothetical protein LAL4801_04193 [Roseibium aggregatum]